MIFKDSQSLLFDRFSSFVTDWFHCVIMWRRLDASFLYAAELTEQRRERASNRRHARTVNDWRRRRDVIGRRRHRAQRQGDFFLPCHHDTGTCTHTLQRRLLAAAFTRIVVLSGHGGGCQGHHWYGLFWGCFQGVIEFSLCLFFAKLVSYTFLFWLPTYINHTGASRCGGALFYPSEIWSHPLVVVRSHCQCRVLEFVVFIFSKKLLMMIQAIIDTITSVKWHVCWHWCTIECARVRHRPVDVTTPKYVGQFCTYHGVLVQCTSDDYSGSKSSDLATVFDVGGIFGSITAGLISDRTKSPGLVCTGSFIIAIPAVSWMALEMRSKSAANLLTCSKCIILFLQITLLKKQSQLINLFL